MNYGAQLIQPGQVWYECESGRYYLISEVPSKIAPNLISWKRIGIRKHELTEGDSDWRMIHRDWTLSSKTVGDVISELHAYDD